MLPHRANRKAEVLNGFADAIDAGMPLDQAIRIGHSISRWASQRNEMHQAFVRLEFGHSIAAVMQQAKWLTATEAKCDFGTARACICGWIVRIVVGDHQWAQLVIAMLDAAAV